MADEASIDINEAALAGIDGGDHDVGFAAQARQGCYQVRGHFGIGAHVDEVERDFARSTEVEHALRGRNDAGHVAVQVHDSRLRVAGLDDGEVPGGQYAVLAHQRIGPLAVQNQVAKVVALQFHAGPEDPIFARCQNSGEAALANDKDEFVIANDDVTQHMEFTFPVALASRACKRKIENPNPVPRSLRRAIPETNTG